MATSSIILPVQAAKLPAVNPAQIDAAENSWRLLFDATTSENCLWQFRMPQNYSSAPVAKIQYTMASAIAGTLILDVYVMAVSDGDAVDINTDSYDVANASAATTVPGTAGFIDEISIAIANADSLAAGDFVKFKLDRDIADTATGDAEVVCFSIEYTST